MQSLTVEKLFELKQKDFTLTLLTKKKGLSKEINTPELSHARAHQNSARDPASRGT